MAETPENERIRGAIERFEEPLLRFASTIVGAHQARDVVQDVFLELVREPFSGLEDHLAAWMFTVCRNKALTEKRKQRRLVGEEEASVEASTNGGPEGTLETKQSASQLLLAMDALSERDREVVALKFAGGLSYKEIATVMQLTVTHVGVILHEALKKIREHVAKQEQPLVARRA
jgi:RNA polymerase sigma-70 factor (ECF subfamily)